MLSWRRLLDTDIWAITLFGQARFTSARFAEYQNQETRVGENQKGTAGRGREKNVTTIAASVTTIYDILRQFPDLAVAKELFREEMTKCRAYGQRDGFNLQALDRGMTPVVLKQLPPQNF